MQHLGDGGLETFMRVRDDELDASEATARERAKEIGPERLGLRRADRHAQYFAPAVAVDRHRDGGSDGDDAAVDACLDVGGIQPEIGPFAFERSIEERGDLAVDLAAQSADPRLRRGRLSLFEMPLIPIAFTSSSTERVETPCT
jgi:hypothetical protein